MIRFDSIEYFPELSTDGVPFLLANKSSKIRAEIVFTVLEYFKATATNRIRVGSEQYATDEYIVSLDNQPVFANFQEGDLFDLSGTPSGTNDDTGITIVEKISDYVIRTDKAFLVQTCDDCVMELTTPIQSIRYYFGIIENNESINFNSKITGQEQQLNVPFLPVSVLIPEDMEWNGAKEVQLGSATLQRLQAGVSTNQQQFRIIHHFYVDPVTLPAYFNDALNGIAPPYLNNNKTLKHCFRIEAMEDFSNPNRIHETTESQRLGNVGFKDENFNGGVSNYNVTDVQFFRDATNEEIPSLEVTEDDQRIEITIENTVDSPFSNNNTKFVSNFSYSPQNSVEYTGNGKTPKENFYIDRAVQTVGSALVNGENFGTDQQIIKEVTATFVSASEITIEVIIGMSSTFVSDIGSRTSRKAFDFNIEIQDHTLQTAIADLVTLPVALKEFFNDVSDPTIATITPLIYRAYEDPDVDDGNSTINLRSEDNAILKFLVNIDRTGRTDDDISQRNAVVELLIKNDVLGVENVLESYNYDFSNSQLDNTGEQFFSISEERSFKFPDGNKAKVISGARRSDLDSGNLKAYLFRYPFLFRWEDYVQAQGLNSAFFDANELFNGKNNDWNRLDSFADWNFFVKFTCNFIKNGNQIPISSEIELPTFTYLEDADWINETTKLFKGATEITPNIDASDASVDTRVEVTKEYVGSGTLPDATEVHWICRIEVYQQGTIIDTRYIASWEDLTQYSWLKSIDSTNLVSKSIAGNVHKAQFLIDSAKLLQQNFTEGTKLKVSSRIYDTINIIPFAPFITTVDTTIAGSSGVGNFQLPLTASGSYDMVVDWGDGSQDTITTWNQAETLHTYSVAGSYQIKISGVCTHYRFGNAGDKLKLSSIDQWGDIAWSTFESSFFGCSNVVGNFSDTPDLSGVIDMQQMFYLATSFNSNVGHWDVSGVQDIRNIFRSATSFNNGGSSDINNWTTSSLTSIQGAFREADAFNQPLDNWNVLLCNDFTSVFQGCAIFNQNLDTWNCSNVTTMSNMFRSAVAFNNGASSGVDTIMSWTTSSLLNSVREMFLGAVSFNADISSWDVSGVTDFTSMFRLNNVFNNGGSSNINNWNTSSATNMNSMFRDADGFNQPVHSWDVSGVTDLGLFMSGKSSANYSVSNLDLIYNTWSGLTLQSAVVAHFGSIQYTIAVSQAGRDALTNAPNNWIITDGGGI